MSINYDLKITPKISALIHLSAHAFLLCPLNDTTLSKPDMQLIQNFYVQF